MQSGLADSAGTALDAEHSDTTPAFVVDNAGNVHIYGQLFTAGGCKSGCARVRGGFERAAYAVPRMSTPTMEDSGVGRLANGEALVRLDAAFRSAIESNSGHIVFVSAEGDSNGLYVANRTAHGFVVRENGGGKSAVPFSYRIVATPYGARFARLPMIHVKHGPEVVVPASHTGLPYVRYQTGRGSPPHHRGRRGASS